MQTTTQPTTHAKLAPSAAQRWSRCTASVYVESGYPDSESAFAAEGTAAHELAAQTLIQAMRDPGAFTTAGLAVGDPALYLGHPIDVKGQPFVVTSEMADHVHQYTAHVLTQAQGATLMVEQRLDLSAVLKVDKQYGTADAVIIGDDELQVHDLKYGQGVKVSAQDNPQLMLYALAALEIAQVASPVQRVRLVIHQPRLHHCDEQVLSVDELATFAQRIAPKAERAIAIVRSQAPSEADFAPSEKACTFCKASGACKAQKKAVVQLVNATQEAHSLSAEEMGKALEGLPLVEQWCKAIKAKAQQRLMEGQSVPGFKLVLGRAGNRKWGDAEQAAQVLLSAGVPESVCFERSLVSPTTLEKLKKQGTVPEQAFALVSPHITRSEPQPTIAPESDRRQAWTPPSDTAFHNLNLQP